MEFTITLSEKEIDQGSENLYKELTDKYGCRTKDAKLTCLTAEEIFLSVRDHFGNDHSVDAVLKKRFGRTFLQICFVSEPFDPRQNNDETSDLLSMYGLIPNYIYKNGKNIITIPVETKKKSQSFGLLAAVIITYYADRVFPVTAIKNDTCRNCNAVVQHYHRLCIGNIWAHHISVDPFGYPCHR